MVSPGHRKEQDRAARSLDGVTGQSRTPRSGVDVRLHRRCHGARRCVEDAARILNEYTCECHLLRADRALRSEDVLEWLSKAVEEHGAPQYLCSDNGPECRSG